MKKFFSIFAVLAVFMQAQAQWVDFSVSVMDDHRNRLCTRYDSTRFVYQVDTSCAAELPYVYIERGSYVSDQNFVKLLGYFKHAKRIRIYSEMDAGEFFPYSELNFAPIGLPELDTLSLFINCDECLDGTFSLNHLPVQLKELELINNFVFEILLDKYPDDLKSLKISHATSRQDCIYPVDFPERLENLEISDLQNDPVVFILPESLKKLLLEYRRPDWSKILQHKNLEAISVYTDRYQSELHFQSGKLKTLRLGTLGFTPSSLKVSKLSYGDSLSDLYLEGIETDSIYIFPGLKNIQLTSVKYNGYNLFHILPDELDTLNLRNMAFDEPLDFFNHIQYLNLYNVSMTGSDSIYRFPDDVLSLNIYRSPIKKIPDFPVTTKFLKLNEMPVETLPSFPDSLKELALTNLQQLSCIPMFPKELRTYVFDRMPFDCIPNETDYIKTGDTIKLCDDINLICDYHLPTKSILHTDKNIQMYPNPAKNKVRVEWTSDERATLRLMDISGKVIQTQTLNQNYSDIDISKLSKGMYLIQVQSAESLSVGKLLVQ